MVIIRSLVVSPRITLRLHLHPNPASVSLMKNLLLLRLRGAQSLARSVRMIQRPLRRLTWHVNLTTKKVFMAMTKKRTTTLTVLSELNITPCMLTRSGMHKRFWCDAYKVAQMLCNRLPANGYMTPYEFINGAPPNMEYFRVWGSKCYVRDQRSDLRKDWSDRSRVGALMGYSETTLVWKVYVPRQVDYFRSCPIQRRYS
jgi:hypothetical protein